MRCAAAVVLVLLLAPAVRAQPAEPRAYFFRGALGFGTQSLADVNDDIAEKASTLRPLSTRLDWDAFGDALPFGLEFGYQYSERWSWAFGFTWHRSTVEHVAQLDFVESGESVAITYVGARTESQEVKLIDLYGTATLWVPPLPGLHLGAQLGYAMGSAHLSDHLDLNGNDGSSVDLTETGDANASGFSAGIYAGYEATVSPMLGLSARVGYLQCNLGKTDGRFRLRGSQNASVVDLYGTGPVTDTNGQPMDWDFSGVRASGAVTFRFRWSGEF